MWPYAAARASEGTRDVPDYALMNQYLYEGNAKEVEQMTKDALAAGRPVQEVLVEGLIAGMSVVGEDFKHNVLYVPEVLIAARAMKAGMAVLKPLLSARDSAVERPRSSGASCVRRTDTRSAGLSARAVPASSNEKIRNQRTGPAS